MQLGVRWRAGEEPHAAVPTSLHSDILAQERLHPEGGSWTLTWLEGRPRCALDDAVVVALEADGTVSARHADGAVASPAGEATSGSSYEEEDDDDDWLS